MNLLIFFSIVFATIIFAIILERIIRCPILVGFAFFAAFLIVAAIFNSTILVIVAIALGILAFIVAFLTCIFRHTKFFRNNRCLICDRDDDEEDDDDEDDDDDDDERRRRRIRRRRRRNNCNCDCDCKCNCNCRRRFDDIFTILNSSGKAVARINGNNNGCGCRRNDDCNNSGFSLVSGDGNMAISDGNVLNSGDNSSSNCGCCGRNNRRRC